MTRPASPPSPSSFTTEERSRGGRGAQRAMAERGTRYQMGAEEILRGARAGGEATRARWKRWRAEREKEGVT